MICSQRKYLYIFWVLKVLVFTKKHHSGLLCTFHCVILITHFKIMNKNNIENTYRKKPGFLAIGNTRQKISWQRKVGSFSFYNLFVYFFSLWRNKCYILIDLLLTLISLLISQLSISDQFYCVSMFVLPLFWDHSLPGPCWFSTF